MKGGVMSCSCGKTFYCETINDTVACIDCGTVLECPEIIPIIEPGISEPQTEPE